MPDPRMRLTVVGIVTASLFAALFARLGQLQLVDATKAEATAETFRVREVKLATVRGRIFDRKGQLLVYNRPVSRVTIDKRVLAAADRPLVLSRLATLLEVPYAQLDEKLAAGGADDLLPVPVAQGIRESAVVYIKEHPDRFPGVVLDTTTVRAYPFGGAGAHIIGYVGAINADEQKGKPEELDYDDRDVYGKGGVERSLEARLRGRPGKLRVEIDRRSRIQKQTLVRQAKPGDDVYLTIDIQLQQVVEDAIAKGLATARREHDKFGKPFKAPAGALVVLDARDGSVLAAASYPTYNPAEFVGGISRSLNRRLQDPNSHGPLNNRAVSGLYAPGSTFKPFTAMAALGYGLIGSRQAYLDEGKFRLKKCPKSATCVFYNAGKTAWGVVDLRRALTVSSDAYFYSIGARFWEDQRGDNREGIQRVARDLGFGSRTTVELPNEFGGRVPDRANKLKLKELGVIKEGAWVTGDSINTAIGQGLVAVTPLQLARAYAAIANGGKVLTPSVLLPGPPERPNIGPSAPTTVVDGAPVPPTLPAALGGLPTTTVVPLAESFALPARPPTVQAQSQALAPSIRTPIVDGLLGVISRDEGTAFRAFEGFPLDRFRIAGKTGTAEVTGRQDTAVFVAFGPVPDPRFVVAVVMEEAGFGGNVAAPVARRVFEALFGLPFTAIRPAFGARE